MAHVFVDDDSKTVSATMQEVRNWVTASFCMGIGLGAGTTALLLEVIL